MKKEHPEDKAWRLLQEEDFNAIVFEKPACKEDWQMMKGLLSALRFARGKHRVLVARAHQIADDPPSVYDAARVLVKRTGGSEKKDIEVIVDDWLYLVRMHPPKKTNK